MNTPIITFPIKTGTKTRMITTYKNNSAGHALRIKHKHILESLDLSIFDYNVTYAYLKEQNTKKLVQMHVNNDFFYQLDVKDFFKQIDHDILQEQLNKARITSITKQILDEHSLQQKGIGIGLLLSPFLSNLYLRAFDQIINCYCQANNIIYTRYADDLTFSSLHKFDPTELDQIINFELKKLKLSLNHQKTKITYLIKPTQSVKILGINIVHGTNSNYLTISRKFKAQALKTLDENVRQAKLNYITFNDQNFVL